MKLANGVGVVTGAAAGIGRAVARVLARRRMRLALLDIDAPGLQAALREPIFDPARTSIHVVDVADFEAMKAAAGEVKTAHGNAVHLLVNNAGIHVSADFTEIELADLRRVMNVNLWGIVHGTRAFLPLLQRAERAQVANVLSGLALLALPGWSAYCISKFAARGFTEVLRTELRGSGVGVTAIYPPAVSTNLASGAKAADPARRDAELRAAMRWAVPVDRVAERIVRGIEHEKQRLFIGGGVRLFDWSARVAPVLGPRSIGALARSAGITR